MRKFIIGVIAVLVLGVTPQAGAVDGFSQPTYSPNSDPTVHQTAACSGLTSPYCRRWVRVGGTFMQGPKWQLDQELPLVAISCSLGERTAGFWQWRQLVVIGQTGWEFCFVGNPPFWRRT